MSRLRQRLRRTRVSPPIYQNRAQRGLRAVSAGVDPRGAIMKVWPASLRSRLMIMIFLALLLANALTLSLLLYERMSSARSVAAGQP